MKKGDERRGRILETAERLFYQKGYEHTSIQDILDELKLSKGGFYHHFESKLQLLDALCQAQMLENGQKMKEAVDALEGDALAQFNALYAHCTLWQEGQLEFAGLVIRAAYEGGSVQLRDSLRQAMLTCARPVMQKIIFAGIEQQKFFTRYADDIGELLLQLFANLNDEIAMALSGDTGNDGLSAILNQLTVYRHAAEMLTGAPYGSVVLYDLDRFPAVVDELRKQKSRLSAQNG